jgi:hypothetical protein
MRTVRLSAAISLDWRIAGPRGEFDWVDVDPEIDFAAMMSRCGVVVMGRRTYEDVLAQAPDALPELQAVIISRTLKQDDRPGVNTTITTSVNAPDDPITFRPHERNTESIVPETRRIVRRWPGARTIPRVPRFTDRFCTPRGPIVRAPVDAACQPMRPVSAAQTTLPY